MSGLVSSLVSSLSLLTAASVSETTVVFNGCVSIVVGCWSIIGRYPPGSVDQCVGRSGDRCTNPSYACEQVSTSMRAETLVLGGASPEHHEAGPDPQVRPASRGESCQEAPASEGRVGGSERRNEDLVDDMDHAIRGGDVRSDDPGSRQPAGGPDRSGGADLERLAEERVD